MDIAEKNIVMQEKIRRFECGNDFEDEKIAQLEEKVKISHCVSHVSCIYETLYSSLNSFKDRANQIASNIRTVFGKDTDSKYKQSACLNKASGTSLTKRLFILWSVVTFKTCQVMTVDY